MKTFKMIAAAVALTAVSAFAANPEYVSGGFESPRFTAGNLAGQDVGPGPWVADVTSFAPPATVTAVVAPGVGLGGTQGVRVNRTGDANGYFSVVKSGVPSDRYVDISFDMNVSQSNAGFGPFFGVQAYGGPTGADLLGSVGVDATTGEILFQTAGGVLTPSSNVLPVAFGSWHNFDLSFDYATMSYQAYVDGVLAGATSFVTPSATFYDAPISAFEAAGTPASLGATGTAFFDNYFITVPEPTTISCIAGLFLLASRRRSV